MQLCKHPSNSLIIFEINDLQSNSCRQRNFVYFLDCAYTINSSSIYNANNLTIVSLLVMFAVLFICYYSANDVAQAADIDVKCTVYEHSDDVNGNNVDVRILVIGLEQNKDYIAHVTPEHNPPTNVSTKSDSDGTFWAIAKIPNGEKSLQFDVDVYEGNSTASMIIASGNDDAPCHGIPSYEK